MKPYLYFTAVVVLWATTPAIVQRVYAEQISPLFLLAVTASLATATLLAASYLTGRWRQAVSWTGREWAAAVGMGLLGIAGYNTLYYLAFRYGAPDEVNAINYLWPVFMVLLSGPILGERHTRWTWAGLAVSFVGAAGILTGWRWRAPTVEGLPAYGFAASGAVCWALFSVLGKRMRHDKLTAVAFYNLVAAVLFGAALAATGVDRWPGAQTWALLIFLGAIVDGVAYVLWFEALAGGPVAVFGNLVFVTPFLALLYLRVFSAVPFRPGVWISLALIVTGALISLHKKIRR
ncbi:MAG: EamA family transporter [Candidatus Sumerlaeia bacterium]|nr:EamA family transporter [Candidatus Sumerlaeia bacterium]